MAEEPTPTEERKDRRGAPKGSFGNPPHEPTDTNRRLVETHVAVGTPQEVIGQLLDPPISVDTLTRHYQAEIDLGLHRANAVVGGQLYGMATGRIMRPDGKVENVDHRTQLDAAKFWQERRGGPGWRQRNRTDLAFGSGAVPDEQAKPDSEEVTPLKITVEFVPPSKPFTDDK